MTSTPPATMWLTSARHRSSYAQDEPFGTAHARALGSSYTACGQVAHSWRYFWNLPFKAWSKNSCPECALVVREQPEPRIRTSSL